jgi:hypothetical protein
VPFVVPHGHRAVHAMCLLEPKCGRMHCYLEMLRPGRVMRPMMPKAPTKITRQFRRFMTRFLYIRDHEAHRH